MEAHLSFLESFLILWQMFVLILFTEAAIGVVL